MIDNREKILQLIRMKGPVIPLDVSKAVGTNVLFASAMLSELVDKGIVKISHLKIGGSPLYYLPGQESKLQNYYSKLNDKQRKAYDLLKEKQVLQDSKLEPVLRVALRDIKDFAIPLQVSAGNINEIFWKWYLTTDKEAEVIIKQMLGFDELKKREETHEQQKTIKEEKEIKQEKLVVEEKLEKKETKKLEKTQEEKIKFDDKKDLDHFVDKTDAFGEKVRRFFDQNSIEVIESKTIKKKSEFEFLIKVPSAVGKITYHCIAKNKSKINDKDLSYVYVHGQAKKLPVLFLVTGELTKKATEMLEKEFKNVTVKKI